MFFRRFGQGAGIDIDGLGSRLPALGNQVPDGFRIKTVECFSHHRIYHLQIIGDNDHLKVYRPGTMIRESSRFFSFS